MPAQHTPESFWRLAARSDNGCLEWQRRLHKDGYGEINYRRKYWLAHRLAWFLTNGPIPEEMCVCHVCDNPKCIDPAHLFLGTHADNMGDMKRKGRRKGINCGEKNGRSKITRETAIKIRDAYQAGDVTQNQLATLYGIAQPTVSLILTNKIWD
jgi:predicted XRE-type DNA-binding protein